MAEAREAALPAASACAVARGVPPPPGASRRRPSARWSARRRAGRPRRWRSCSAATGRERTGRRGSSCTTPRPPRTWRRRRSSRPSARSIASTGAGRSGRGCTGSSSTARSTTRGRARCAARCRRTRWRRHGAVLESGSSPAVGRGPGGARAARARAPRGDRAAPPARVHARRDREGPRTPAGDGQLAAAARARCPGRAAATGPVLRSGRDRRRRRERRPSRRGSWTSRSPARRARGSGRSRRSPRSSRRGRARRRRPRRRGPAAAVRGWRPGSRWRSCSACSCSPSPRARPQPGAAVRGFVVRVLGGDTPPAPRARIGPLPPGRMLVTSPRGAWVVARRRTRTLLGAYTGAAWSPRGLYVVAWSGADVHAVAPDGRGGVDAADAGPGRERGVVAGRLPRRLPARGRPRPRRGRRHRAPPARRVGRPGRAGVAARRAAHARVGRPERARRRAERRHRRRRVALGRRGRLGAGAVVVGRRRAAAHPGGRRATACRRPDPHGRAGRTAERRPCGRRGVGAGGASPGRRRARARRAT